MKTSDFIAAQDLPHRRIESWKFTNIKPWLLDQTYQSHHHDLLSTLKAKLPNARIEKINDISKMKSLFDFQRSDNISQFAQNTQLDAYHIIIGKSSDTVLELDLNLMLTQGFSNTLLYFTIEESASFKYLALSRADSGAFKTLHHYFHIKKNASVQYARVQNQDTASAHLGYDSVLAENDSFFETCNLNIGAQFFRHHIDIALKGEGAHAALCGVYNLNGNQHSDTTSIIHHFSPHTTSRQLYKGILDGESRGVFTGKIFVHKDAQLINSEQLHKTLLLSKSAHSHSQPQLEIFADDVKCSHGSTTGQLSDDEIFYLQSRGIAPEKASKILSQGFALDVLFKMEKPWLKKALKPYFEESLS